MYDSSFLNSSRGRYRAVAYGVWPRILQREFQVGT